MGSDRAMILARRRVFMASALAGLTAACDREAELSPTPEASVANTESSALRPCLSILPPDASAAPHDSMVPKPTSSAPRPRPCLSVRPPKTPTKPPAECNPPYYTDAKGIKRVKPGCM